MIFIEGQQISYHGMTGLVNFVCDQYITMLVRKGEHRAQDCNLIVYPTHYKDVIIEDGK